MIEIFLENNHRIDIVVTNPITHTAIDGSTIIGVLSVNPTGSAAVGAFTVGPSSSFSENITSSISNIFSESIVGGLVSSFTTSILQEVTQSFTSSFSSSITGSVRLEVTLTEDPECSGQYNGVILGSDITTVFSSSLSESIFNTFIITSASFVSASFGLSGSITNSFHTTSVSQSHHVTQSNTASFEIPLVETPDRCAGIFEIISSGSLFKVSTPMNLRSVRFLS